MYETDLLAISPARSYTRTPFDVACWFLQVDLIVDPDATFFKASWSKHTNFCQQDIEITQNSGQMAYGQEIQYQVCINKRLLIFIIPSLD